jgi:hypothetical protein
MLPDWWNNADRVRRLRTAVTNIPEWYVSVESHGENYAGWGKLLTRPPELSGNPTSRDIWVRVGGMDEGVRILRISSWDTSTVSTRRKILRHGAPGFTFNPKEFVLRGFIVLRNPSLRPGLSPRLLDTVARTLTTTPPKRLDATLQRITWATLLRTRLLPWTKNQTE